jgi:hypothetical protein
MTNQNVFTLKNSDLNLFLFTDVGTELIGSELTMLSILARLGRDPWAEAAQLAKLPKAQALDSLTHSIGAMALGRHAMDRTAAAASQLILLLPEQRRNLAQRLSEAVGPPTLRQWAPIALICASLAFSMAVNMVLAPASHVGGDARVEAPSAVHIAGTDVKPPGLN